MKDILRFANYKKLRGALGTHHAKSVNFYYLSHNLDAAKNWFYQGKAKKSQRNFKFTAIAPKHQ